jgi:hypothetical protein
MKFYIDQYQLKKNTMVSEALEREFDSLNAFFLCHCHFDYYETHISFDCFDDIDEKMEFIHCYRSFLRKVKKEKKDENIEDEILPFLKKSYVHQDYEGGTYITEDEKVFYVEDEEDIPSNFIKANPTLVHGIPLDDKDMKYILKNGKFPKGIPVSIYLPYFALNRIPLDMNQFLNLLSKVRKIEVVKILLSPSIFYDIDENPYPDFINHFEQEMVRLLVKEIQNAESLERVRPRKDELLNQYEVYLKKQTYIGSLRKEVWRSLQKRIKELNDKEKEIYRNLNEELALEEDMDCLESLAYSYYEGNNIYPQDYEKARIYLEKLASLGNDFANNSLGYLYYYGRVEDKKPIYEKAYHYFSLGEQAGIIESTYKLGDMYKNGYYVKKRTDIAYHLYERHITLSLNEFTSGFLANKLPDIALRLAECHFHGTGCDKDIETANHYIELARFSSSERIKRDDFFGNMEVHKRILSLYEEIHKKYKKNHTSSWENRLSYLFDGNETNIADIRSDGKRVSINIRPRGNKRLLYYSQKELRLVRMVHIDMDIRFESHSSSFNGGDTL